MSQMPMSRCHFLILAAVALTLAITGRADAQSSGNRLLGLDVSAWQGNISQTTWNNIRNVEDRQFVFLRASRGGTTGEDHLRGGYPSNDNTFFSLSQRYDDPYFIQNINRATAAGMYAGSYHFSRPDVIASTPNSGGIANTGSDEADHFIQMAGAFMRPGYLPPVHDLEAGDGARSDIAMAQFTLDFSNRIYEVMGIRPAIYINGNYAQSVLGGGTSTQRSQLAEQSANPPSPAGPAYSQVWSARWPNQSNPNSIPVQTAHPKDTFTNIYGPWDDYGVTHPWVFWQYASTGRLNSYNNGNSNLDFNVVQGGIDYLKDQLVPAIWWHDQSGDWNTLANWNSGQEPIVPIASPGQLTPFATGPLPTPRRPGAAGSGPTAGQNDTVILDRPNANITITLSSGSHNIRKLFVREALNITGGSLTVNYVPVPESTPMSAQFSSPVSISGGASLTLHTLFVDDTTNFTAGNSVLTFDTLMLERGGTPSKLVLNGNVIFSGLSGGTAQVITSAGASSTGLVDLSSGTRTFIVADGAAADDLHIAVPIANGTLTKSGTGTMLLSGSSTYTGSTTISAGTLRVSNLTGSATGPGGQVSVQSSATLKGGNPAASEGFITGPVTVFAGGTIAPGNSIGTITLGAATIAGTYEFEILQPGTPANPGSGGSTNASLHDQIKVAGTMLDLTAGSVVKVVEAGPMTGFNSVSTYSWTIGTTLAGTPTIHSAVAIDMTSAPVLTASGGRLFLTVDGPVVNLNFAPIPEPSLALAAAVLALIFIRSRW